MTPEGSKKPVLNGVFSVLDSVNVGQISANVRFVNGAIRHVQKIIMIPLNIILYESTEFPV